MNCLQQQKKTQRYSETPWLYITHLALLGLTGRLTELCAYDTRHLSMLWRKLLLMPLLLLRTWRLAPPATGSTVWLYCFSWRSPAPCNVSQSVG